MATKTRPKKKKILQTAAEKATSYAASREKRREIMSQVSAAGREIGPIPRVKNPWRREWACRSTKNFAETYLMRLFQDGKGVHWPWSETHLLAFSRIDEAIIGGLFVIAMPRASAKTSCLICGTIRAILCGLHNWACIIAATGPKADKVIQFIQTVFETNQLLLEDFPEAIYPIRQLERNVARCRMQTCMGRPTRMEWHSDIIVLPDIPGSLCAGAIITGVSLEASAIRGQIRVTPNGTTRRPTLVLPDDPTTDEISASPYQTDSRWDTLNGAVMQMCPPDRPMCALAAVTVIKENDLCDRMLKDPQWSAIRCPMLVSFPVHRAETSQSVPHADWWDQYASELRDGHKEKARMIYAARTCGVFKPECVSLLDKPRECRSCEFRMDCMDADAVVSWIHRKHKGDLTAVQQAMDLHILKPKMFASEMQQRPLTVRLGSIRISPAEVCERISGLPMWDVPPEAAYLCVGIDVHKEIFYITHYAAEGDFTGQIIGYSTFPEQPTRWFRQADPPYPLSKMFPGLDEDATIFAGLKKLAETLLHREYSKRAANGIAPMQIRKILCDGRYKTKVIHAVRRALRNPTFETVQGVSPGPNKKPLALHDKSKTVDKRIYENWYRPIPLSSQDYPHVTADVNYWKMMLHRSLSLAIGTRGAVTLFGLPGSQFQHEPFAEHVAGSEYSTEMPPDSYGRIVTAYLPLPGVTENHWLDSSCYAMIAASIAGCQWPLERAARVEPPTRKMFVPSQPARRSMASDPIYS